MAKKTSEKFMEKGGNIMIKWGEIQQKESIEVVL